jgi:Rho GTPase-activating protein 5
MQAQVMMLEQKFVDSHSTLDLASLELPVHAVATSLKNFFSCLPEPVIPIELHAAIDDAQASATDPSSRLSNVRQVLRALPRENRELVRFLCAHLRRVADNAERTSMSSTNLAKCWWPTLMRPHFDTFESMAKVTAQLELFILQLLEHYNELLAPVES